jgi:hypothetical protein
MRTALLSLLLATAAAGAHAEGFGVDLQAGYFDMTNAHDSAKAVFDGSSGGFIFGGEATWGFRGHFYVAAAARYFHKDGERVFVADNNSPVFRLGHPLKVSLVPVYGVIGYRFGGGGSLTPYLGLGVGFTTYHEESTVAGITTSADDTKFSGRVLGGLEYGRGTVRVGIEAAYSTVPDTIGVGGVSKIYGEKDVGGFSAVAKLIFTRAQR